MDRRSGRKLIQSTVIADTINNHNRITTLEITIPKIFLAQLNKHKIISNNAESSRAVPYSLVRKQILKNPYVPERWGINGPGMSPQQYVDDPYKIQGLRRNWLDARDESVRLADLTDIAGIHKELVNRYVENWRWCNVVLTSTTWTNFIGLRSDSSAQWEMQQLSKVVSESLMTSEPIEDVTHLPYTTLEEGSVDLRIKLSVARCAKISYNRTSVFDVEKDVDRYESLLTSGHFSAFEHTAVVASGQHKNFTGWCSVRTNIPNEHDITLFNNKTVW